MANIGSLILSMEARIGGLEKGLARARRDISRTGRSVENMGDETQRTERRMTRAFGRVSAGASGLRTNVVALSTDLRGLAAAVAGAVAVGFVTRTIAATDTLAKFADRVGLTVQQLQEYRFAASQVGVEQDALDDAFLNFGERISEAALGTGEAAEAFQELQLNVRDTEGRLRSSADLFDVLADRLARVENPLDRLRLQIMLFGDEGSRVATLLDQQSQGIERLRRRANDLGIVLSERLIRNAAVANQQLAAMGQILQAVGTRLAVNVATALIRVGQSFTLIVEAVNGSNAAIRGLTEREQVIVNFIQRVGVTLESMIPIANRLFDVASRVLDFIDRAAAVGARLGQRTLAGDLQRAINQLGNLQATLRSVGPNPPEGRVEELTQRIENLTAKIRILREAIREERQPLPDIFGSPLEDPDNAARLDQFIQRNREMMQRFRESQRNVSFVPLDAPERDRSLGFIERLNAVLHEAGIEFDFVAQRTGQVEEQLRQLLSSGVDPTSAKIRELVDELQMLRDQQQTISSDDFDIEGSIAVPIVSATQRAQEALEAEAIRVERLGQAFEDIQPHIDRAGQLLDEFASPREQIQARIAEVERLSRMRLPDDTGFVLPGREAQRITAELNQELFRTTTLGMAITDTASSIGQAFQESFRGVMQGTVSVAQAFDNMVQSIAASLLNTGLQRLTSQLLDLALSLGASLFGVGAGAAAGGGGGLPAGAVTSTGILGAANGAGPIMQPQLMLVGDAGASNPEFVLNTPQLRALTAGNQPQISIINVPSMEEAENISAREQALQREAIINIVATEISGGSGSRIGQALRRAQVR